jgi:DNA-binding MarR family transcriptional regulator
MGRSDWLDEREAHAWRAFLDLRRRIEAVINQQLTRDAGLSSVDYELLVPLSESPDGVLRARDLGRMVGWERSRLSHQITRMEKRGLVVREDCAVDARGSMVRLTDAGRAAIESAAPEHVQTVRRHFFDPLTTDEIDTLCAIYDRLIASMDADPSTSDPPDPPMAGGSGTGNRPGASPTNTAAPGR